MKCKPRVPTIVRLHDEEVEGVRIPALRDFIRNYFGIGKTCHIILKKRVVAMRGLALDMIATQDALYAVRGPVQEDTCDIILTSKLFATPGDGNRLHLRTSVYNFPSIISTSGIVEGPAKPLEYYLCKQQYTRLGIWDREAHRITERFKGLFIDYGDRRLTEVIKGYIAQALFFHITGDPFCPRKTCRLFNAHWQEDLIRAQIASGAFCNRHTKFLTRLVPKQ